MDPVIDFLIFFQHLGFYSTLVVRNQYKLRKKNRLEVVLQRFKQEYLIRKKLPSWDPNVEEILEVDKNWIEKTQAMLRVIPIPIECIIPVRTVYEFETVNMKEVAAASVEEHKEAGFCVKKLIELKKKMTFEELGRDIFGAPQPGRKKGKGYKIRSVGMAFPNLSRFDEPTPEDMIMAGLVGDLEESAREANDLNITQHLHEGDRKESTRKFITQLVKDPEIICDEQIEVEEEEEKEKTVIPIENMQVKLKFSELQYFIQAEFKQSRLDTMTKSYKKKVLQRMADLEKEGKGANFVFPQMGQVLVANAENGRVTVNVHNSSGEKLWVEVQDPEKHPVKFPIASNKNKDLKVTESFACNGGEIYVWVQLPSDHMVGCQRIKLSDLNPTLRSLKRSKRADGLNTEKRWRSVRGSGNSTEEDSLSGLSFLMEEDEVCNPMPTADGWEEEEDTGRGERPKSYQKGKKHKKFAETE